MNSSLWKDKVILAPMVRGSELAFRQLVRTQGGVSAPVYSPMLRASEVVRAFEQVVLDGREKYEDFSAHKSYARLHEDGKLLLTDVMRDTAPLVVQLCGCNPTVLRQAVGILCQVTPNVVQVDLNLGCPQPCAEKGDYGAFLLENNFDLTLQCIQAMRSALEEHGDDVTNQSKPKESVAQSRCKMFPPVRPRLSCKMRLQDTAEQSITVAQQLEKAGCELLAVHCRKRHQKHDGAPDWTTGKAIVDALSGKIPVVLNGGITSIETVKAVLEDTKAHAVMVGAGFLTNPLMLVKPNTDPAVVAAAYLEYAAQYPPPSPLFLRKHLRWIFRGVLAPKNESDPNVIVDYSDWRPRLWTFLVRPYLETLDQFRQVVALYVKLNGSTLPESLCDVKDPSFKTIRHANRQKTAVQQLPLDNDSSPISKRVKA